MGRIKNEYQINPLVNVTAFRMSTPVVRHNHRHNLKNRFQLVKTLGQGTYGKVKLAIEKSSGRKFAIKSIRKNKINSEKDLTRIRREIEIMSTLSHQHIISVYEVFENSEKIVLVMEHASGGELYDYINDRHGLSDNEARRFFRQIVSAVHYLHQYGIVHRDLKLENIMLDGKGNAMIGDFGLANLFHSDQNLHTFCGSPLYAAPEIVSGLPYKGPEVDCWSLGVLLYTLVYGAMPFDGSDFKRLRRQITEGDYFQPQNPSDAAGLIRKILVVNPANRADVDDISEHWWVNLGYEHTPAQEPQGAPINFHVLEQSLTFSNSSDSDSEGPTKDKITLRKPLKGILKKPKDFSPKFCKTMTDRLDRSSNTKRKSHQTDTSKKESKTEPIPCSNPADNSESELPKSPDTAFDSNRKPKRGILKNKHKYSGADSGCVLEEINVTDYFGRTPPSPGAVMPGNESDYIADGFLDEAEALYNAETRAFYNMENVTEEDDDYELDDIEAVLDSLDLGSDESLSSEANGRESVPSSNGADVSVASDTYPANAAHCLPRSNPIDTDTCNNPTAQQNSLPHPANSQDSLNSNNDPETSPSVGGSSSSSRKPVKGILKRNGRFTKVDPAWRHSIGSQSSNSSGDVLDFSYDSTEGEVLFQEYQSWPIGQNDNDIFQEEDDNLEYDDWPVGNFSPPVMSKDNIRHPIDLLDDDYYNIVEIHREAVSP